MHSINTDSIRFYESKIVSASVAGVDAYIWKWFWLAYGWVKKVFARDEIDRESNANAQFHYKLRFHRALQHIRRCFN